MYQTAPHVASFTVFKYDTALLMYEVTLKYICRYQG